MNYFTKIPEEVLTKIFFNLDYLNLSKLSVLDKSLSRQYNSNKEFIYQKLIKNYGYTLVETNTSFNFQKKSYCLSINKNKTLDRFKLLERYMPTL